MGSQQINMSIVADFHRADVNEGIRSHANSSSGKVVDLHRQMTANRRPALDIQKKIVNNHVGITGYLHISADLQRRTDTTCNDKLGRRSLGSNNIDIARNLSSVFKTQGIGAVHRHVAMQDASVPEVQRTAVE